MRIAMPTDSYLPTRDGVSTAVVTTKRALEDRGHDVIVIAPDPGEDKDREVDTVYFRSRRFRSYPGYFVPVFPSNKMEVFRDLDVDIIHCQGQMTMAIRSMLVARHLRLPIVLHFHTMVTEAARYYSPIPFDWDMAERFLWRYFRSILQRADAVIAPSESIAQELLTRAPGIRHMAVVPVGIDLGRFRADLDGHPIRKRHGIEGRKVVAHISRLSFEKNIDLVLRAMGRLDDDTVLLLVGAGPAEAMLKQLTASLGLDDRVVFTGFVSDEDLPLYYACADAFVLASCFETQGLVVIEAMACGLPVAAIDFRALRDTVVEGYNGFLFQDDELSCAQAIARCLDSDEGIRKNARKTAEGFSLEVTAERLLETYEEAIRIKNERLRES